MGRAWMPAAVCCGIIFSLAANAAAQTAGPITPQPRPPARESDTAPTTSEPGVTVHPGTPMARPTLRRDAPPPPIEDTRSLLDRAASNVISFAHALPNFLCQQVTARYISYDNPPNWELQDTVEADVAYIDGKESYTNVRRDGAPDKPAASGAWSSGEFGTMMLALFQPDTGTRFTDQGDATLDGAPARLYDFAVDREHSRWRVAFEQLSTYPAYSGSIWIDPATTRVLRIEMAADDLPKNFGLDTVEMAVDYGSVRIGDQDYVLTTSAANLACQRGTPICTQNEINFHDYRKFTADSVILPAGADMDRQ